MSEIIDGKAFADQLSEKLTKEVAALKSELSLQPCIAVVLVGDDPASHVYVKNKVKRCEQLGIRSIEHRLEESTSQQDLLALIASLNENSDVHGILVQLPVPEHIDDKAVLAAIDPTKDVDGFHVQNMGALAVGEPGMVPCTPLGSLMLLKSVLPELSGKHAVIVGRSNIVGKPMALLLLQQHCTVTIVHSRTIDIEAHCRRADILVAAVGIPHFIKADWVKPGAVVIDVGINRIVEDGKSRLVGDVDFDAVRPKTSAITPVPGGVGPMTIACLMHNTIAAAKAQHQQS
ncbi:MAG: bifunctional methylenetetrahydrofolate dehydrogenase/methenyltetrahydrofolate cyclohydrolase FolD [Gammaproteobacteria bacterium]|nr:bifunctional methylenetetrahydrofolate dehydrogenase/methenyltetrahydrofolate cyclohydrolase FolD [Gammaproteobacteria bacterium]NND40313.1 bifunctional methylenetetrahydrofolate dehydrogenase/methenyltetrahydrofolate cyclohydrolase FolD [Pseudomonadales bacterium]NNL11655.1 bifunctional methylenetetrahydrofolate dehydrogenase/methenyltetrahydrofolate cyclohydrolase FolD [Pseudomonadales bacterium]RZV57420.1 MAG: bifunctional methylenetetrahydrofolate dehydrogenase/methenyltetrahydrofolate cy